MEIKSTGLRLAGWTRPGSYCLGILSTARGEAEWSSRAMPSAPHGRLMPRFRRPGAPDSPRPPPGLWLLRAESGLSLWVLSWGPPKGRGCLQAAPGPAGRPGVGRARAGPGAKGRGSLFGTRTGSAGTRWDGARRRREGRDCAWLGAWCRWGLARGPGLGRRAVWDGGQQQWPSLGASAAGACGRCGRRAKKQKERQFQNLPGH